MRVIKTLLSANGASRVQIYENGGWFAFTEESVVLTADDWTPTGGTTGIYDTAETAEREARMSVSWLREEA
jgi:hypothetical protein